MAIRKVARLGHPVLRQVAREVPTDQIGGVEIRRLVEDLRDTIAEYEGVGLAAPQIFDSLRVFAMLSGLEDDDVVRPPTIWINPQLVYPETEQVEGWEGCLSIPDLRGLVPRRRIVEVSGFDETGKVSKVTYEGFPAVVAQHEHDHLEGIVFLDRMREFSTLSFLREFERYHVTPGSDADEEIED
jgi:peptide deformylase